MAETAEAEIDRAVSAVVVIVRAEAVRAEIDRVVVADRRR